MRKLTSILIIILFFSLFFDCKAQWKQLDIEGGLTKKVVSTSTSAFTMTQTSLYKSDLSLSKWQKVDVNFPYGSTLYCENNTLLITKNGSNEPLMFSINNGDSWESIPINKHFIISNPVYFNGFNYIVAKSSNMDTTVLYRIQNDSLIQASIYPNNYTIFSSQDTLYFKNNSTDRFYYSTNISSLILINEDLFILKLDNLIKYKGLFYGVYQGNKIYYSTGNGYWRLLKDFPNVSSVLQFSVIESSIFFNAVQAGKIIMFSRATPNSNWEKLDCPNSTFNNIIRTNDKYIYSSNYGIYQFNLNNNWSLKMNGINIPILKSGMYHRNGITYFPIRDSLFSTVDNGNTVKESTNNLFNNSANFYFKYKDKGFVISNGILYSSDLKNVNFTRCELPDTNFYSVVYIGENDSNFFINVKNKANNGAYILSSHNGLNFNMLNNYYGGSYFRVCHVYTEHDTLFAINENRRVEYYSVTSGNSWQGTKSTNPIYIRYPIYQSNLINYGGFYFLHLVEYGKIDDIDHYLMKKNGQWIYSPSNLNYVYNYNCFTLNGLPYKFESKNQLLYSDDSLKTFKNTNISFDIVPGQYVNKYLFTDNTMYVEMSGGGLWRRPLQLSTGLQNKLANNEVLIYPNPSSDYVKILFKKPEEFIKLINIYSLQGSLKSTYNSIDKAQVDNISTIYLKDLEPGYYILKLTSNFSNYSIKLLVN